MGDIRIKDLTTAANLSGEDFLAVDNGMTQKTKVNDLSTFIRQKYQIERKISFLTPTYISVGTSINDLDTSIILVDIDRMLDIPENILPDLGSWILIFTFVFSASTGTQFITSLFNSTADNCKIFKRHKASGIWSDFASIF